MQTLLTEAEALIDQAEALAAENHGKTVALVDAAEAAIRDAGDPAEGDALIDRIDALNARLGYGLSAR